MTIVDAWRASRSMTLLLFPGDHTEVHIERLGRCSHKSGLIVFIIFGGLPATGKTTLARELARQLGAVYLRIDTIEQAIAPTEIMSVGEAGYRVGYAVAEDNLRLGRIVVADSVNPLRITRDAWRNAAKHSGAVFIEVLVVCSDQAEHRRRVETRKTDVVAGGLVTWQDV